MTPSQGAQLALLVINAMDGHEAQPISLAPPIPRLEPNWKLLGHVTGNDVLFRIGRAMALSDPTCFGYLAQSTADPALFAVAIRGTYGILEWIEDGKYLPMAHPVAGKVESGFFTLYETLQYRPLGTQDGFPLAQALGSVVKDGRLQVIGHSLGAPLATYLTFDLADKAILGDRVEAVLFASPRPGNADFGAAFQSRVGAYSLWNYELDLVPRVPIGPDYADLPGRQWITLENAQARIAFSIDCWHHLLSYCSMLDFNLLDWAKAGIDAPYVSCIKGPN